LSGTQRQRKKEEEGGRKEKEIKNNKIFNFLKIQIIKRLFLKHIKNKNYFFGQLKILKFKF